MFLLQQINFLFQETDYKKLQSRKISLNIILLALSFLVTIAINNKQIVLIYQ
jgi:hypothetical protein